MRGRRRALRPFATAALATAVLASSFAGASGADLSRADVVAAVATALGLQLEGREHVTGALDAPVDAPSYRLLRRLLTGHSYALVVDAEGAGRLVVMPPGTSAAVFPPPSAPAPLWGLEDVARLARAIGDDDTRMLVEASTDADVDARLGAVTALAGHGVDALDALAAATHDPDATVRFTAMQHLAVAGAPAAPHLVAAFHEGSDGDIRALALSALFAWDPDTARPLVTAALADRDPAVRRAAEALAAE